MKGLEKSIKRLTPGKQRDMFAAACSMLYGQSLVCYSLQLSAREAAGLSAACVCPAAAFVAEPNFMPDSPR